MQQSIPKRSQSLTKSFNFPNQTKEEEEKQQLFYMTDQKQKKVDKRIQAPFNSWRELSYNQLLEEAVQLLMENQNNVENKEKLKIFMSQYKQFKSITQQQQLQFKKRSSLIKSNIENLIVSQNDFKFFLSKIEKQ